MCCTLHSSLIDAACLNDLLLHHASALQWSRRRSRVRPTVAYARCTSTPRPHTASSASRQPAAMRCSTCTAAGPNPAHSASSKACRCLQSAGRSSLRALRRAADQGQQAAAGAASRQQLTAAVGVGRTAYCMQLGESLVIVAEESGRGAEHFVK